MSFGYRDDRSVESEDLTVGDLGGFVQCVGAGAFPESPTMRSTWGKNRHGAETTISSQCFSVVWIPPRFGGYRLSDRNGGIVLVPLDTLFQVTRRISPPGLEWLVLVSFVLA